MRFTYSFFHFDTLRKSNSNHVSVALPYICVTDFVSSIYNLKTVF